MARRDGLSWNSRDLLRGVEGFEGDLNDLIAQVMQRQAVKATSWMKINAPWTDRTGNARNTLLAEATRDGDEHGIIMSGAMPYQIYLETKQAGKFAIIQPAMIRFGTIVMTQLEGLMDRLRRR